MKKVIIVEGKSDKERLLQILNEPVEIICTNGTLSTERLERWITDFKEDDVYVLVDADDSGEKIRKQINREFASVHSLYTRKEYREIASTPVVHLTNILANAHFVVKSHGSV